MLCKKCQGNGEVVRDWERYLHAHVGDVGDEATEPCPDCEATGLDLDLFDQWKDEITALLLQVTDQTRIEAISCDFEILEPLYRQGLSPKEAYSSLFRKAA